MTSKPPESPPEWPMSGPAASEPLDALPLAEDGFPVPDGRWHTGPLGPVHTGPISPVQAAPPGPAGPAPAGDERLAALSYLGVPFLGPLVPLAVYLTRKRASGYVRRQSVQALNLSVTALLYTLCTLILGAMLALDSVTVALLVVVPMAAALWLVTLVYVILAASRASRGGFLRIPAWLCATILH